MSDGTKIEWTDATVNAVNGCSVVSPGCTNCYAMRLAGTRLRTHPTRKGLTVESKAGPVWNGEIRVNEKAMLEPLRWTRPRTIFWNAHGDLFHPVVPIEVIDRCFAVMALTPHHRHQVLTKRSARMRDYLSRPDVSARIGLEALGLTMDAKAANPSSPIGKGVKIKASDITPGSLVAWPLPNVWMGVSVEDQQRADERIPDLLATPAAVRFISAEPLLGPVDLTKVQAPRYVPEDHDLDWKFSALDTGDYYQFEDSLGFWECGDGPQRDTKLDWVIIGGESGPKARPMHPDWARSLRDQCAAAGVPFFMKQWGAWREAEPDDVFDTAKGRMNKPPAFIVSPVDGTVHCFLPSEENSRYRVMLQVGKHAAGRLLDGVPHDGMPL